MTVENGTVKARKEGTATVTVIGEVNTTLLKKLGSKSFSGIAAKAVIAVPKKKLASYRKLWRKAGAGKKVTFKKA